MNAFYKIMVVVIAFIGIIITPVSPKGLIGFCFSLLLYNYTSYMSTELTKHYGTYIQCIVSNIGPSVLSPEHNIVILICRHLLGLRVIISLDSSMPEADGEARWCIATEQ